MRWECTSMPHAIAHLDPRQRMSPGDGDGDDVRGQVAITTSVVSSARNESWVADCPYCAAVGALLLNCIAECVNAHALPQHER
eukprot:2741463-Alexandrium_andersonii.AAC.1